MSDMHSSQYIVEDLGLIDWKRLHAWVGRRGWFKPTNPGRGTGNRRGFSFADVVALALATRRAAVPLGMLQAAIEYVQTRRGLAGPGASLKGVWLASDGETVVELVEGAPFKPRGLKRDVVSCLVPLGDVAKDVSELMQGSAAVPAKPPRRSPRPLPRGRLYR